MWHSGARIPSEGAVPQVGMGVVARRCHDAYPHHRRSTWKTAASVNRLRLQRLLGEQRHSISRGGIQYSVAVPHVAEVDGIYMLHANREMMIITTAVGVVGFRSTVADRFLGMRISEVAALSGMRPHGVGSGAWSPNANRWSQRENMFVTT